MVNEWNKTAFVEFETMLRRRLRSGAAPVTACAGFDLDAASAYLEGALGGSHRAGYESHLAGCATCRRHLIELARLAQTAPLAEPQIVVSPATAPGRIPAWDRWKTAVTAWFDLSSRSLKWRLAGATGAAFAILIAALGVQSWRQTSRQGESGSAVAEVKRADVNSGNDGNNSNSGVAPSERDAQSSSSTPEQDVATRDVGAPVTPINQRAIANTSEVQSRIPAPALPVGPQGNAFTINVMPSNGSLALDPNQPIEPPAVAKDLPMPNPASAVTAARRQRQDVISSPESSAAVGNSASRISRQDSSQRATEERPQSLHTFKPHIDLMDPKPPRLSNSFVGGQISPVNSGSEQGADTQSNKSVWNSATASILKAMERVPLVGPRLSPNSEPERKTAAAAQETADAGSPNPMVTKINGKIFHRVKGVLIDQEYKPEMDQWTRWLKRDSKEYKEILEKDPSLTVFFERGPILIVWKNGIYKILK
jgi:hypothetical protein